MGIGTVTVYYNTRHLQYWNFKISVAGEFIKITFRESTCTYFVISNWEISTGIILQGICAGWWWVKQILDIKSNIICMVWSPFTYVIKINFFRSQIGICGNVKWGIRPELFRKQFYDERWRFFMTFRIWLRLCWLKLK